MAEQESWLGKAFVGREEILSALRRNFRAYGALPDSRGAQRKPAVQALIGFSGIGKTAIAEQFARQAMEDQLYSGVHWLNARDQAALVASSAELTTGVRANRQSAGDGTLRPSTGQRQYVRNMSGKLVVIDNADSLDVLSDELFSSLLPRVNSGLHLIIVSRRSLLPQHIMSRLMARIEVSPLCRLSTAKLLCKLAGRPCYEALLLSDGMGIHPASTDRALFKQIRFDRLKKQTRTLEVDKEEFQSLLFLTREDVLGGLPLAVELAAAHLRETDCSFSQYKNSLLARNSKLHRSVEEGAQGEHCENAFQDGLQKLFHMWELNFEALTCASRQLLAVAACLQPDKIPCLLFLSCPAVLTMPTELKHALLGKECRSNASYTLAREHLLLSLLSELRSFSLISFDKPDKAFSAGSPELYRDCKSFPKSSFSLHPLIQKAVQHHALLTQQSCLETVAVELLLGTVTQTSRLYSFHHLLPHALKIIGGQYFWPEGSVPPATRSISAELRKKTELSFAKHSHLSRDIEQEVCFQKALLAWQAAMLLQWSSGPYSHDAGRRRSYALIQRSLCLVETLILKGNPGNSILINTRRNLRQELKRQNQYAVREALIEKFLVELTKAPNNVAMFCIETYSSLVLSARVSDTGYHSGLSWDGVIPYSVKQECRRVSSRMRDFCDSMLDCALCLFLSMATPLRRLSPRQYQALSAEIRVRLSQSVGDLLFLLGFVVTMETDHAPASKEPVIAAAVKESARRSEEKEHGWDRTVARLSMHMNAIHMSNLAMNYCNSLLALLFLTMHENFDRTCDKTPFVILERFLCVVEQAGYIIHRVGLSARVRRFFNHFQHNAHLDLSQKPTCKQEPVYLISEDVLD